MEKAGSNSEVEDKVRWKPASEVLLTADLTGREPDGTRQDWGDQDKKVPARFKRRNGKRHANSAGFTDKWFIRPFSSSF